MFEAVEFLSEGEILRGRFYPSTEDCAPCVVMAHGTTATISMVADAYA